MATSTNALSIVYNLVQLWIVFLIKKCYYYRQEEGVWKARESLKTGGSF
jgi:hypothetical protein